MSIYQIAIIFALSQLNMSDERGLILSRGYNSSSAGRPRARESSCDIDVKMEMNQIVLFDQQWL